MLCMSWCAGCVGFLYVRLCICLFFQHDRTNLCKLCNIQLFKLLYMYIEYKASLCFWYVHTVSHPAYLYNLISLQPFAVLVSHLFLPWCGTSVLLFENYWLCILMCVTSSFESSVLSVQHHPRCDWPLFAHVRSSSSSSPLTVYHCFTLVLKRTLPTLFHPRLLVPIGFTSEF